MHPRSRTLAMAYLVGTALALAVLPVINLRRDEGLAVHDTDPFSDRVLFSVDFILSTLSRVLYRQGVSIDPRDVVIGKQDWLFVGDSHGGGLSAKRFPATAADAAAADRIAAASAAWARRLRTNGVDDFRILICPDKDSAYPEFLPGWGLHVANAPIDVLVARSDRAIWVDARPAMAAARSRPELPLYAHTDTHWNAAGAWVAYRALAEAASNGGPAGRQAWLSQAEVGFGVHPTGDGDLARFLRLGGELGDVAVDAVITGHRAADTTARNFRTGTAIAYQVLERVGPPQAVALIHTPAALNAQRVLWITDSFGAALLPYMTATWSDVLQSDREALSREAFMRLVEEFKPQRVYISVVERNARAAWFERLPPS